MKLKKNSLLKLNKLNIKYNSKIKIKKYLKKKKK